MQRKYFDWTYRIGLIIKAFDGIVETAGSFLILFASREEIFHLLSILTHEEIAEDPKDLVANFLLNLSQYFTPSLKLFTFAYLFVHGAVKIFLAVTLLARKLWAYPIAMLILLLFIIYQVYRYFETGSVWLIWLTALDILLTVMTYWEYKLFVREIKNRNNSNQ